MSTKQVRRRWQVGEPLPPTLTVDEAAEVLNLDRRSIYAMCESGELESSGRRGRGKPIRIWSQSVVDWARGRKAGATGTA